MNFNIHSIRNKILLGVASLATAGIIGLGGDASAATLLPTPQTPVSSVAEKQAGRLVHGTIKTIDTAASTIILTGANKQEYTVTYSDTTLFVAGKQQQASISDLKVGDKVTILIAGSDTTTLTAKAIMKGDLERKLKRPAVHGTVNSNQNGVLTIENKQGITFTVNTTAETRFVLSGTTNATVNDVKVGSEVTAIGKQVQTKQAKPKNGKSGNNGKKNNSNSNNSTNNNSNSNGKPNGNTNNPNTTSNTAGNRTFTALLVTDKPVRQVAKQAIAKHSAAGTISALNSDSFTLTHSDKQGKSVTLTVQLSDQTTYFKGKQGQATKNDLKVGSKVVVVGERDTTNQTIKAQAVHIADK